ncbi:TraY domain-containing protein [Sphingobium phenoxybenzoativorans]|uniref:TraY domain-containing protein n=1 Tax=Sphingobium phenoxybenzoativorans TaxID=1592790 RepID=A0A975K5K2_9SPHN|nr:TraY domain-containing protein [Sphingobium phenoxybenzoativorans]QUT05204.1 TraY domain-containing protein [Sphingobium phenoxybenzoativorans]
MSDRQTSKKSGGRPPERDEAKRSAIAVRTTADVKRRLEAAATASGKSLTQEIERRLEQSLSWEKDLGGGKNIAFFIGLANEFSRAEAFSGRPWHEDHATWTAAKMLTERYFSSWRPLPPNSSEIAKALKSLEAARSKMRKLEAEFDDAWPLRAPETSAERLLAASPKFNGMVLTLPKTNEEHAQYAAMTEALSAAADECDHAERLLETACELYDEESDRGRDIVKQILDPLHLDRARQTKAV